MDPTDETRPSLVMPMDNIPYVSEYEKDVEEKMIRNEKQTQKHTIMTMTLNEIVENTIKTVALFSHEYTKHIYQVSQDHKLRGLQDIEGENDIKTKANNITNSIDKIMSDGKEYNETKTGLGLKKLMKTVPSTIEKIRVQYTNRKGTAIDRWVKVPKGDA